MKDIVEKLKQKEIEMSEQKGPFHLFALFLREDIQDKWDLLVAAPWISEDKSEALKYIGSAVQQSLDKNELMKITRVVMIDDTNPALEALQRAMSIEHGSAEIMNSNFFGLNIKHAYLITSKRGQKA